VRYAAGHLEHVAGLAIDNYKTETVVDEFRRQGLNPRGAGNSVTVTDPDGLAVQVTAVGHHP
jgi:hypothetical protein